MKFEPITEPNVYGKTATLDNRKVEVVRCYTGQWHVFEYIDSKLVIQPKAKEYPYPEAMHRAMEFLTNQK